MKKIIEIKDLRYNYGTNVVFNGLNLDINKGEWVSIVGPNGSGKTTLIKLILGILKGQNHIHIDNLKLNKKTLMEIRKKIGIVFQNPDNQFVGDTVKTDIAFSLENIGLDKKEINKRVDEIASFLKIENILDKEPHLLSGGEKQKVALASALVINPKILILDEAFSMIDPYYKKDILNILKKIHRSKALTIITITHDLEDTLLSNRLIILDKGNIVIDGKPIDVFQQEKIIEQLELDLPFMVDLSLKLKFYNLVDKIYFSTNEMVNHLWK
ncbi:MAG: energy-coupling factor transporter ATPase [Bacilli bacterium]